ncbi:MAG: signal peptidase I [Myxococcota bacterium]|jgi:signal peptidase I|nr:signal peptidase I [Myxococcota bacterium]HON24936.1 signal peptidase I [Myxococcota bacterium]HOS61315.1 signal peptidase I [Myxococcota bacterium]HPC92480.1 signal peptidase I [Myxococcota bacterium]HPL24482.1 signal peptidase I [Myxococcota bacterium]
MTSSSQTFQRSAARLLDLILPGLGLLILGKTFWGSTILMVWTGFIATLVTKVLQLELHLLQSVYLLILIWITSNISISLQHEGSQKGELRWRLGGITAAAWLTGMAILTIILGQFFSIATVPSTGMFPSLTPGEVVVVRKVKPLHGELNRLWVAKYKEELIFGRVVALPNETILIDGPQYSVNHYTWDARYWGRVVMTANTDVPAIEYQDLDAYFQRSGEEHIRVFWKEGVEQAPIEQTIPLGHVFLLADNRSTANPGDSRQFGPVPIASLLGRAQLLTWSPDPGRFLPKMERMGLPIW